MAVMVVVMILRPRLITRQALAPKSRLSWLVSSVAPAHDESFGAGWTTSSKHSRPLVQIRKPRRTTRIPSQRIAFSHPRPDYISTKTTHRDGFNNTSRPKNCVMRVQRWHK